LLLVTSLTSGQEVTAMLPGDVPLVMVRIPAGTFQMGSPSSERERDSDETLHQVTLTHDYFIGKYEVTQAQWEAIMGSNPSVFSDCGGDCPVDSVSWNDIAAVDGFMDRLNQHLTNTGQPEAGLARLPTEAEWEKAARAGTSTRYYYGDALECDDYCVLCDLHDLYMWWCGNNDPNGPKPVGGKLPNSYGLYDMHGNAWEIVSDFYGTYPSTPQTNPTGPADGGGDPHRVVRGGGWDFEAEGARSAQRSRARPDASQDRIAFRIAMDFSYGPAVPIVVEREPGRPSSELVIWESCGGPGEIVIHNNQATAQLFLNGEAITIPGCFNDASRIGFHIELLEGENQLEVLLSGQPGTGISVEFIQNPG
jgi:formylglycine-generating enzyme required for sulfatase activity